MYETDEFLQQFISEKFDSQEFTKQLVETKNISNFLKDIDENIERLNVTLHQHVITHHEDLLSQAVGIGKLESVLASMLCRTTSLVHTMDRIRQRIHQPHQQLELRITQLQRLQVTCDAIRKIIRAGHLIKRLQSLTAAADIVKSSALVNELELLFQNFDWEGIHILVEYRRITQQTKEKMEEKAWKLATASLECSDHTALANALQVFHNIHKLGEVVEKFVSVRRERFTQQLNKTVTTSYLTQAVASSSQRSQHKRGLSGGWLNSSTDDKTLANNSSVAGSVVPGRANLPSGGQAAQMRATLWNNLDQLLEETLTCTTELHFLEKLLRKKRDYSTQNSLWRCLHDDYSNLDMCATLDTECRRRLKHGNHSESVDGSCFVEECLQMLKTSVEKNCQESGDFLKQSFESEYPKILKLFSDFEKRLIMDLDWDDDAASGEVRQDENFSVISHIPAIAVFLEPFEQSYLSRSLSRLFDPVELVFSHCNFTPSSNGPNVSGTGATSAADGSTSFHSNLPTEKELDSLIRVAVSEITFSSINPLLQAKVVRNVVKMLRLINRRIENLAVVDGEASQVTSAKQTDAQVWNVALVLLLHHLQNKVDSLILRGLRLDSVRSGAQLDGDQMSHVIFSNELSAPRNLLHQVMLEQDQQMHAILQPLLQSISDSVEAILLTMHQENFCPDSGHPSHKSSCSLYMRELQEFIQRVRQQYLSELYASGRLYTFLQPYVSRCVELFLTHASLLRPLNEVGSLRLAADAVELELALNPLCMGQLSTALQSGPLYQRLRLFRKILFDSVEDILQNPDLGTPILPRSLVLHHLFSRAPSEMKSPHEAMHWSFSRYSQWLLDHPEEKDRIAFIQGALDAYGKLIRNRGDRQYHPLYPIMMTIVSGHS